MLDQITKINHDKAMQLAEMVNQLDKELSNSDPKDTTVSDNIAEYLSDFGENNGPYLVMALIRRLHCAGDKGQVCLAKLEESIYVRTCGVRKNKEA